MTDEGKSNATTSLTTDRAVAVEEILLGHNNKAKSEAKEFRNYDMDTIEPRVLHHYRDMRTYQTVDFYRRMAAKYSFENGMYRRLMTIDEALAELEHYVDASDPDLNLPNKLHLLQTAEGIRRAGQPDWMQLTGLLHDMGKIMFLWGTANDGQEGTANGKQWALIHVGGGMSHSGQYNVYQTIYGMYPPHIGLDQLCLAWGHDEYMYRMLVANQESCTLPREALDMIRYHSAYPLHDRNTNAYFHLLKEEDEDRLEWVRLFNQFDLYTKDGETDLRLDIAELWLYYSKLLEKYGLGGKLKW